MDRRRDLDLFSSHNPSRPADILASLDQEQYAAATAPGGGVVVRAGAGTGKTRTLVGRIQYLVTQKHVPPKAITAVTFTNKAAEEIRERVAAMIGRDAAKQIRVGTFHGISARIIRMNSAKFNLSDRYKIVTEDEAKSYLMTAVRRAVPLTSEQIADGEDARIVASAQKRIHDWKSWGLLPGVAVRKSEAEIGVDDHRNALIYVAYQRTLQEADRVDFGDLVLRINSIMHEDEEFRIQEASKVRHLLVDEAQDANPVQIDWCEYMTSVHGNVFVVGDEDQSIFGFQGGTPAALDLIPGEGAHRYALTINRRCTQEILKPAVDLVNWNRRKDKKVLRSEASGEPVGLRIAGMEREEATALASAIKTRIDQGVKPAEIAVLVRSSWLFRSIEEGLIKAGISYEMVGGRRLIEREEVRDIAAYIQLGIEPRDHAAFDRASQRPARGIGPAASRQIVHMVDSGMTYAEACQSLESVDGYRLAGPAAAAIRDFGLKLETLESIMGSDQINTTERMLAYVLDSFGFGYLGWVRDKAKGNVRSRLDNIRVMQRIAVDEPSPMSFMDVLSLVSEDDNEPDENSIRLSTMHSSKGLEWDVVFCPAFEMDVVPNRRAIDEQRKGSYGDIWNGPCGGGMEEERRLIHVAMTRARKELLFSCSTSRSGKTQTPSSFIPEAGLDPLLSQDPRMKQTAKRVRKSNADQDRGRKGFSSTKW